MALDDGYDNSYKPPEWWRARVIEIMSADISWTHGRLAKEAALADGRGKKWDSSRVTKLFQFNSATIQLVAAISEVLNIPPPVFEAKDEKEAEAFNRWLRANRRRQSGSADTDSKEKAVTQALDASVRSARDQTKAVSSKDEGSPRDPRTRRAPRGR